MRAAMLNCLAVLGSVLALGGHVRSIVKAQPAPNTSPFISQQRAATEGLGQISGRVTTNGNPCSGLAVELLLNDTSYVVGSLVQTTSTDKDGRYQFDGLVAHHYWVRIHVPGFISKDYTYQGSGRRVSVATGARVTGADINLIAVAAISGRITDIDGNPVSNEPVDLIEKLYPGAPAEGIYLEGAKSKTDSNGVFRIEAVPPGEYFVAVGEDIGRLSGSINYHNDWEGNRGQVEGDHYYEQTFYPGVTDRSQASKVSLVSGKELDGVDMVIGRPRRSYSVSGHVVNEATGNPVAGCLVQLYHRGARGGFAGGRIGDDPVTGPDGSFHFEGLIPGRFFIRTSSTAGVNMYGDPLDFEVSDADVSRLELKVRPALKMAGSVVVEGIESATGLAQLSGLKITCTFDLGANGSSTSNVEMSPDGQFEFTGLAPGPVELGVEPFCDGCSHFKFVRIDRPKGGENSGSPASIRSILADSLGKVQLNLIDNLQGVHVVLRHCCSAAIRCHVNLPPGAGSRIADLLVLLYRHTDKSEWCTLREVGANGDVIIENLEPGEYQINLRDNVRHIEGPQQRISVEKDKTTMVVLDSGSKN